MSPILPSLTGIFEQLDGQRPGDSLYDLIMKTRFVRQPRARSNSQAGSFQRVVYESRCGVFTFKTELLPNSWSTWGQTLEMTVPETSLCNRQYASPPPGKSIFIFDVRGHGKPVLRMDLRQGEYKQLLIPEFCLEQSRDHEWNKCWTREDSKTFFDRGDFDEIWKAVMLLAVSIDRTDPDLKMKNRWWSRKTVGRTLFRRHIENAGSNKTYVP
jgi:hypothetical protein